MCLVTITPCSGHGFPKASIWYSVSQTWRRLSI